MNRSRKNANVGTSGRKRFGRRTAYVATIAALIAATGGFAMATVLTPVATTQSSSWYQVSNGAVSAFPSAPTVVATATPTGVSACSTSPQAFTDGTTLNVYLGATGSIVCTAGDFAEEFSLTSSATAAAATYPVSMYTTYGSAPTSGSATVDITISTAFTTATTLNVYVDYGTAMPPTGGIAELDLIVQ